jgi:RimJ/RimL family protein N-acetyltransferase
MNGTMLIVWSYEVDTTNAEAFERAYGKDGEWTALFRTSPDFLGTELLRGADGAFVTIDRWTSAEAYDAFLAMHAAEYERIDGGCEQLTRSERLIGRFVAVTTRSPCVLRDVAEDDLPIFFEHQRDPEATRMAAFPARQRDAFMTHWRETVLGNVANQAKAIVASGKVAGNIVSWTQDGRRFVGYWIGRDDWRKGVATSALSAFLFCETTRPLYAWVAEHNVASIRVLEKCGFVRCSETDTPRAGDDGIVEALFILDGTKQGA